MMLHIEYYYVLLTERVRTSSIVEDSISKMSMSTVAQKTDKKSGRITIGTKQNDNNIGSNKRNERLTM